MTSSVEISSTLSYLNQQLSFTIPDQITILLPLPDLPCPSLALSISHSTSSLLLHRGGGGSADDELNENAYQGPVLWRNIVQANGSRRGLQHQCGLEKQ